MPTLRVLAANVIGLAALLGLSPATDAAPAASDDARLFQENVTIWAKEDQRYVEAWWEANLDADPKLERVAILCDAAAEEKKGVVFIEKDRAHRWEISFEVDQRTKLCRAKPATVPVWEKRSATSVELEQGRHNGSQKIWFALRVGQPVIVREEEVSDATADPKPVVTDWDLLIKKKKEKNYQLPEGLRPFNR